MTLELDMGYYTIYILPKIHYLTTIVTEFGKYRYNIFQMGLYAFNDILQSKVHNILGDIGRDYTYINNILVPGKSISFNIYFSYELSLLG